MRSLQLAVQISIIFFAAVVCGCAGGGALTDLGSNARTATVLRPIAMRNPSPAPQSLCVGGTTYVTTQDDEFSQDTFVNYSPDLIHSTPQPNGAIWSSRGLGFVDGYARNNVPANDAYYTDPSRGLGSYSPFSLSDGALHIEAKPVPSPYATASPLAGAHWFSGVLESPAQMYGYIEVSAEEPNLQGFFPAALWLIGLDGDDGKGDGYEELDVNEMFGSDLPPSTVQQTQTFSPTKEPPPNYVRRLVSPDPGQTFHTYGVLWTPAVVRFFIDRRPTSPDYANAANGPANAVIDLGVFAQHAWSPPPRNKSPRRLSLHYYRWYQSTNASCSPANIPT